MGFEEPEPVGRGELEGRRLHLARDALAPPEPHDLRRKIVDDPAGPGKAVQVVGQRAHRVVGEVRDHPLGQHQRRGCAGGQTVEEAAARAGVGQVQSHALDATAGLDVAQPIFLPVQHLREVDLDPAEAIGPGQPVGAGVQSGAQVQDRLHATRDGRPQHLVDDDGADDHLPLGQAAGAQVLGQRPPAGARHAGGVGIAEQRVRAFRFLGPPAGDHESGVGDTCDPGIVHALDRDVRGWLVRRSCFAAEPAGGAPPCSWGRGAALRPAPARRPCSFAD